MTQIIQRNMHKTYKSAVKGDGCYIIDEDGKRYIDASCGAAISCLGHSDEIVKQAIIDQLDNLAFAHTSFLTSKPAEALAEKLTSLAPGNLNHMCVLSGGSEANEAALKLARQYFYEKGEPERGKIIARKQSYHGNTIGTISASGNPGKHQLFKPLMIEMSHVEPCYAYRYKKDDENEEEYAVRAANSLEEEILRLGPKTVAAFIAEPVSGSSLGAAPSIPGYFKRIREICDKYGVLLILDEVMCGMGRTGTLFAYEQEGITPDIVSIAKGLGAGYQSISGMLCTDEIYNVIDNGSGVFQYTHSYVGHPTACAASLAVIGRLVDDGLVDGVHEKGEILQEALEKELSQHQYVGDIRGRGLFRGVEIVKNRETKEPFDPSLNIHAKIKKTAQDQGMLFYPTGGTVNGKSGDHMLFAPPFIATTEQLQDIASRARIALDTVLNEISA